MTTVRTRILPGGELAIPTEYWQALGVEEGDEVWLCLDDGELRIVTPRRAIATAQGIVRQHIPPGRSLADELIAERRAEAGREEQDPH